MTMHLTANGEIATTACEVTRHDLAYVIGISLTRPTARDPHRNDLIVDMACDAEADPEYYWNEAGLDEAAIATELLRRRMPSMQTQCLDGDVAYVAAGVAMIDERARFLESLEQTKPIIREGIYNSFLYEGYDAEMVYENRERGANFVKDLQKYIDTKRGFYVGVDGQRHVVEPPSPKKSFLENLVSWMNPWGGKKKDNGPWYEM